VPVDLRGEIIFLLSFCLTVTFYVQQRLAVPAGRLGKDGHKKKEHMLRVLS
jgi:hypothetical protein